MFLICSVDPNRIYVELVAELSTDGHKIAGIALIDNSLLVVSEDCNYYIFNNQPPYQRTVTQRLPVHELNIIYDMVALNTTERVYFGGLAIYSSSNGQQRFYRVWILDIRTQMGLSVSISNRELYRVQNDLQVQSLSVAVNEELLLTTNSPNTVYSTSADGAQQALPWRFGNFRHAAKTSSGSYIVSATEDNVKYFVMELTRDGNVLRKYSGPSGEGMTDVPHLAVDVEHDHVYLADYHNHRILVLNKDLQLIYELVLSQGDIPYRLKYSTDSQLFIVGMVGGTVKIYSVVVGFQASIAVLYNKSLI